MKPDLYGTDWRNHTTYTTTCIVPLLRAESMQDVPVILEYAFISLKDIARHCDTRLLETTFPLMRCFRLSKASSQLSCPSC